MIGSTCSHTAFAAGVIIGAICSFFVTHHLSHRKKHPSLSASGDGELSVEKGDDECFSLFYDKSELREEGKPFLMPGTRNKHKRHVSLFLPFLCHVLFM